MARIKQLVLAAVCVAAAAPACENGIPSARDQNRSVQAPVDFGPTAAYERRLIFLGPGQRLPSAAIVDFVSVSDSLGLRRGVRARLADGDDWSSLMDAGWEMERMREPWRLVPHGPLRLVVGDAGDLGAVVFRSDPEVRLEPGATVAVLSPDPGLQLVLRQGRLVLGADLINGIMLDTQLGRSLDASASRRARDPAPTGGSAPDRATPAARPGAEALLVGEGRFYMVFASSSDTPIAWLRHGQQDDVRRGARLAAVGWELDADGFRVPNAWEVVGPSDLSGELSAEAVDGVDVSASTEVEGLGYAVVSGWILDRGVHRDVYGLVRHVR
jgi:hypothetical protein